jgi:hypothetical protein
MSRNLLPIRKQLQTGLLQASGQDSTPCIALKQLILLFQWDVMLWVEDWLQLHWEWTQTIPAT